MDVQPIAVRHDPCFGHDFGRIRVRSGKSSGPVETNGLESGRADEDLNAATLGETLGDIERPVGAFVGNVVGTIAGALTGISIDSTTNVGPTWSSHGRFNWRVGFSTTARSGWIVQEIVNTYRAQTATGAPVASPPPPAPHFWEAWAVDGSGKITPHDSAGNNDYWVRASRGNNTQGHWSTTGSVHFTKTDPATKGFTRHNKQTNAGMLLSSTSNPGGLGIARLSRYAQGTWDSTGKTPTHTGSAGP